MTPDDIRGWHPEAPQTDVLPLDRARQRVEAAGEWGPWQALGRRFSIGCVALEITQRCNLDCTFCYLSETSEALHDIPLAEVFRRIDLIRAHYGEHVDVQVTGGEPTLRPHHELIAIVRYLRENKLRASLLTNGIKASRSLLAALAANGLTDVAFHVDMTQARPGFRTEQDLDELRLAYIERARGLDLSVFFNTTVTAENRHEIPDLVRFFARHCDVVRMCSFQLGAATGRGTGIPATTLTKDDVLAMIQTGVGAPLSFDAAGAGPAACNRYAYALLINGRGYDLFADAGFTQSMLAATAHLYFDRRNVARAVTTMMWFLLRQPRLLLGAAKRTFGLVWRARRDLIAARGRIGKLSFFVHSFMGAATLDPQRIAACSFTVMTPEGPLSMCLHNAKRDDYLLVPAALRSGAIVKFWDPTSGRLQDRMPTRLDVCITRKNARGRAKLRVNKPSTR